MLRERAAREPGSVDGDRDRRGESDDIEGPLSRCTGTRLGAEPRQVAGERSEIIVHHDPGRHREPRREYIVEKPHPREPERIVEQVEWEHWRQASERDDFPSLAADRGV